jgi:hypothetical protein
MSNLVSTLLGDRHLVDDLRPSSDGPGRLGLVNREVVTP